MNTENRIEIEIKLRVDSLPPWRGRLLAQGAAIAGPRALERNVVFDTPDGTLKERGILLRLRRQGQRSVLTMKAPARPDAVFKVREETEADVSDFSAMEAILGALGFHPFFVYEKYREVLAVDGAQVMLDETPIGAFLEIEGAPAAIDLVAARLGFSRADYLSDSYYRLFLLSGGTGDMVFGS